MPFDKETNIVISSIQPLDIPRNLTYTKLLVNALAKHGDKVCQIESKTGRTQTYNDVLQNSQRLACSLQQRGLKAGDLVGMRCGNSLEYLVATLAVLRAGCTVVSIRGQTVREFRYQLEDASPVMVFSELQHCPRILEASSSVKNFKGVVSIGEVEGCIPFSHMLEVSPQTKIKESILDPKEAVMVVTYSAGTTGPPKGVMLTHYNFVSTQVMWDAWISTMQVPHTRLARPVSLVWMPPTHLSGVMTHLGNIIRGVCTVLLSSNVPSDIFETIEKYRVTHVPLMPTRLMSLLNSPMASDYDLSSWTDCGIGGGKVPPQVVTSLKEKFKLENVYCGYSLTELTGFMTTPTTNSETIGCPFPLTEIKVVDLESKESLGPDVDGEICARGPQVMKGYLNDPDLTFRKIDSEGWVLTGDIGHYDEDGQFYVVGRIKDLIDCMDQQVAPAELEEILLLHPSVQETVVVGIPHSEFGEVPRAFVILNKEIEAHESVAQELLLYVADQIEYEKQLHGGIEFVNSLPKSACGIYLKRELRAHYVNKKTDQLS